MTRHYSTTCHAAMLPQLRVLVASMRRHCRPFRLHVLAEGEEVAQWCRDQDDIGMCRTETLLTLRPSLRAENLPGYPRTAAMLAWTRRWRFLVDLLETYGEPVTGLDCDLMFWSSPEPVFEEIGGAGMAVLPHGFAPASLGARGVTMESHRKYGLYNAGWVYFASASPADHFAELCRQGPLAEDRVHADGTVRWGEQGSLEYVAEVHGAHVIQHPGAAPGPWSVHAHELEVVEGERIFGGRPLVAYHYHSLEPGKRLAFPEYEVGPRQAALLYRKYLDELARWT
jgi:hypothetical protein